MRKTLTYLFLLMSYVVSSQTYFQTTTLINPFNTTTNVSHLGSVTLGSTYESIVDPWRAVSGRYLELYKGLGNMSMRIGNNSGKLEIAIAGHNGAFHPLATTGNVVLRKQNTDKVYFSLNNTNNDGNSAFIFGDDVNLRTLAVLNNGRVGIGTGNPDEKLTVKGKIHAEEVRVDLNVPPDYVFQKYFTGTSSLKADYKMLNLKEIEAYVKKNHHLPDVPSAKEIQKEGLHLKEMSAILLQKIEELTLYTIQQQKIIEKLEKKVDELLKEKKKSDD